MFYGVQFAEPDGGSISLVHEKWLTPRKKEVWWPPHEQQDVFVRSIKKGETPNEQWCLYKILKTFFQEDNYQKATIKLKRAEDTSDIATDYEETLPLKRTRKPNRKLFESEEDSDSSEIKAQTQNKNFVKVKPHSKTLKELPPEVQLLEKSEVIEKEKAHNPTASQSSDFGDHSRLSNGLNSCQTYREVDNTIGSDFQKNILNIILQIKQQNKQILSILEERQDGTKLKLAPPKNIPMELPIKNTSDLDTIEEYLGAEINLSALASYCETLGGRDKVGKVNNILRSLVSNQVAAKYSFLGSRNEKHSFAKLNLRKVVNAVLSKSEGDAIEIDDSALKFG